jgi:hypothetical protein
MLLSVLCQRNFGNILCGPSESLFAQFNASYNPVGTKENPSTAENRRLGPFLFSPAPLAWLVRQLTEPRVGGSSKFTPKRAIAMPRELSY